ncbi:OB-fold protein [Flavobacterium sp. XGLA_31]|uniref:OB-fold protein n=1 Tax=Flavobacterium sp. XGLA_31 TaxID=3447666 RepID=UPI003F3F5482
MKKFVKILAVVIVIGAVGFFSARYYAYHGGKRDIQSETAAFNITSKNIVAEFTADADKSNKKYLEKPVAVSGTITSVNGKEIILDNSVNCNFTTADASVKTGQDVTVKGRVVGYDDLLGELKLDQCNLNQ